MLSTLICNSLHAVLQGANSSLLYKLRQVYFGFTSCDNITHSKAYP